MSNFEQSSSFELSPQTAVLFSSLSYLSGLPGGINDVSFHINELAGKPDTSEAFLRLDYFNAAFRTHGFDVALDGIDLNNPQGLPVEVVSYDLNNDPAISSGEIVALFAQHPEEHGAFTGLAVTDLGNGPEFVDISFRANNPGLTYLVA